MAKHFATGRIGFRDRLGNRVEDVDMCDLVERASPGTRGNIAPCRLASCRNSASSCGRPSSQGQTTTLPGSGVPPSTSGTHCTDPIRTASYLRRESPTHNYQISPQLPRPHAITTACLSGRGPARPGRHRGGPSLRSGRTHDPMREVFHRVGISQRIRGTAMVRVARLRHPCFWRRRHRSTGQASAQGTVARRFRNDAGYTPSPLPCSEGRSIPRPRIGRGMAAAGLLGRGRASRLSGRWGRIRRLWIVPGRQSGQPRASAIPSAILKTTSVDSHYHDCDEYWTFLEGGNRVVGGRHIGVAAGDCAPTGIGHQHDLPIVATPVKSVFFETTLERAKRVGHLWNHTHRPADPVIERS